MNIIFLGGIFSDSNKAKILSNSKGGVQFAADTLQKNYIDGFAKNDAVCEVSFINLPFIGAYPRRYKSIFFNPLNKNEYIGRILIRNTQFLNLMIFKNFHRIFLATKITLSEIKKLESKKTILFCYSMHLPFLLACFLVRLIKKDIHLCIIVPDLPEYMAVRTGFTKFVFHLLSRISYMVVSNASSIVIITEHMSKKFSDKPRKIVIEGIADPQYLFSSESTSRKKYFLYSGTLDRRYGIRNLVDSYKSSGIKNYELYICGDGDDRKYVEQAIAEGANIKYLGQLDREVVLTLQQSATLLINPRDNDSEYTKYSFPSKIIEYMSSGVPVLMCVLDGVPKEYYEYCYTVPPGSEGLKSKLIELSQLPEEDLLKVGLSAKEFIIKNKLPEIQVGKLFDYIS